MFDNWQNITAIALSLLGIAFIANIYTPILPWALTIVQSIVAFGLCEAAAFFLDKDSFIFIMSTCLVLVGLYAWREQARADSDLKRKKDNA